MKRVFALLIAFIPIVFYSCKPSTKKIFDVHLHGSDNPKDQIERLKQNGVYKAAISSSWNLQNDYRSFTKDEILYGLLFPCPNGKVPYSLQDCYDSKNDWPAIEWIEKQIQEGKIDFFGEVLSQYYGISASDTIMYPYYQLALKYNLPVGIHTGGAGPNHGSPNFNLVLGDPSLLKPLLLQFPNLKLWVMHAGDQYYLQTIRLMKEFPSVYVDLSVISNPAIIPVDTFILIIKSFIDAGLEDRLMFGTDNADIEKVIQNFENISFLTDHQLQKIYYINAERFFE